MRLLISLCVLLMSSGAMAQQCYAYWVSDCFEIRDATSRDIVHHVLLSPQPTAFESPPDQCDTTLVQQLSVDTSHKALKRFNKVLGRIKGCKRLDSLAPKVFSDGKAAFESYNKLASERAFKVLHPVKRLPEIR